MTTLRGSTTCSFPTDAAWWSSITWTATATTPPCPSRARSRPEVRASMARVKEEDRVSSGEVRAVGRVREGPGQDQGKGRDTHHPVRVQALAFRCLLSPTANLPNEASHNQASP
ncbi:uncharacterized protein LOC125041639 [Penaeus chinensis]|uniref:uncharacterized protein LOC125041639 n=1 Tax=Penaeus chinensis TaxID=139456 RepID=UPI001FB784BD|nr:uncharacterized protein LOC125041639 [Penaeus chinensis]